MHAVDGGTHSKPSPTIPALNPHFWQFTHYWTCLRLGFLYLRILASFPALTSVLALAGPVDIFSLDESNLADGEVSGSAPDGLSVEDRNGPMLRCGGFRICIQWLFRGRIKAV